MQFDAQLSANFMYLRRKFSEFFNFKSFPDSYFMFYLIVFKDMNFLKSNKG